MGLIRTLLLGRKDGIRAGLRRRAMAAFEGRVPPPPAPPAATPPPPRATGPEPPKDVTPPEGFEVVLHADALPEGEVREIIVAGRAIAVANVAGAFHAVTNSCPHAEGPLGEGRMDGPLLTCPQHGWTFDVRTGACITSPDVHIETYEVRLQGPAVCVRI
jgi:nitrite reductase/ring-hydroxylating ferredoxin subunit